MVVRCALIVLPASFTKEIEYAKASAFAQYLKRVNDTYQKLASTPDKHDSTYSDKRVEAAKILASAVADAISNALTPQKDVVVAFSTREPTGMIVHKDSKRAYKSVSDFMTNDSKVKYIKAQFGVNVDVQNYFTDISKLKENFFCSIPYRPCGRCITRSHLHGTCQKGNTVKELGFVMVMSYNTSDKKVYYYPFYKNCYSPRNETLNKVRGGKVIQNNNYAYMTAAQSVVNVENGKVTYHKANLPSRFQKKCRVKVIYPFVWAADSEAKERMLMVSPTWRTVCITWW